MPLEGFDEVNARFRAALEDITISRTQRFVTEVVIAIKADAATMTPVDTSFLINSAYNRTWRISSGWEAEIGYGARYAAAVHGMSGKLKGQPRAHFGMTGNQGSAGPMRPTAFGGGTGRGTYWSPDAEPKFLSKAVANVINRDIGRIIEQQYRI